MTVMIVINEESLKQLQIKSVLCVQPVITNHALAVQQKVLKINISSHATYIEHLLSHRRRVRRALIGQQSFGNSTGR